MRRIALCGLAVIGLVRTPTGFIPAEDQGYMLVIARLPSGATLERTERATAEMTRIVRAHPAVYPRPWPVRGLPDAGSVGR